MPSINLWSEMSKPAIDSIKSKKHEIRILHIDNKSTDNTKIESGKLVSNNYSHKRNEERWSCAKSWNFGIQDAFDRGYDYVFIINNDVLIHPDAIDLLVERFEKAYKTRVILKAELNHISMGSIKPISSSDINVLEEVSESEILAMVTCMDVTGDFPNPRYILTADASKYKKVNEAEHPCFSAFMINKKCWDVVGEFDENFNPAYFEDNDYHRRINLSGMKAIVFPPAVFYHYGSRTKLERLKTESEQLINHQFEKNRDYYVRKWGGLPGNETFLKPFNEI